MASRSTSRLTTVRCRTSDALTTRIPPPPNPPILSDTGFLLSVAATDLLLPILQQRWSGRAKWPRAVHSELVYRIARPGNGVTSELASRAVACGRALAGDPIDLNDEQRVRAELLAEAIGGTDTRQHAGEAAGAVLARDLGGFLACEDIAAATLIQAREGVSCITIVGLLHGLHQRGVLAVADIERILGDLRRHKRPNVEHISTGDIAAGPLQ
jgi:hypothetical protein